MNNLLVSIVGGALAGWVTNSIAVSMLFKKFFGRWGGVIESNYKELIQNLSLLVEQKLVNARTLDGEIKSAAFNNTLRLWVKEILEKELPAKTENLRVRDIPGIDETLKNIISYLEREIPSALSGISPGQIFTEETYRGFVEKNAGKTASSAALCRGTAAETLNGFFSERAFSGVLSKDFIHGIKANIYEAACKIDFARLDTEYYLETFTDIIGIDGIIKKIEAAAGDARIGGIAPDDPSGAARAALDHIADFLEGGAGREAFHDAVNEFINAAETLDTKVGGILHPDLIENLNAFIKRAAPALVDRLILFVIDSREEIDSLIDDAAKQHFSRNNKANNPLQELVFGAVSKRIGFTNKIIEILSQNRALAGENLAAEFNAYIKKVSAGEIVSELKKSGIVNAGIIADALPTKLRALRLQNNKAFTALTDTKIKNIFTPDFSFIKTMLLPRLLGAAKKYLQRESQNGGLREKISPAINTLIDFFAAKKIRDAVDFTKINFDVNETGVKNFMRELWRGGAGLDAGRLAGEMTRILPERIIERVKDKNINAVCNTLQNQALYGKAADAVQRLVLRNLDTVLGGGVFDIAKSELDTLNPRQVNDLVHGFMGRQLKSINIMGAVLGGIAGLVTAAAAVFFKPPPGFLFTAFAAYGLVFALIGVFTNWIAVKMLFRPYKKIAGLNFPPFIGITALKQSEFAAGIAKIIQQNMLNADALRRFYEKKKNDFLARREERISDENHSLIADFFSDETRLTAAVDSLCDYLKASDTEFAEYIDDYITGKIESGRAADLGKDLTEALFKKIKDGGASYLGGKLQERIDDLTERQSAKITGALLDMFYQFLRENLQNIRGAKMPRRLETAFARYIENHTLNDLAGKEALSGFSKWFLEKILLKPAAVSRLAAGITADGRRPLRDYFGGAVPELLRNSGGFVNAMICRLANKNKPVIVSRIMDGGGGASFLERLVKQAANAMMHKDVEAITEIVIDEKLFPFLEARRDAVLGIADGVLDDALHVDSRVFNEENISHALSGLFAPEQFQAALKNLINVYLQNISGVKLKNMLSPVGMDTIGGLVERSYPALIISEITARLEYGTARKRLNDFFYALLSKIFDGQPVSYLLRGIDIEAEFRGLNFFDNAGVEKNTKIILENILRQILSDKDFYPHELFRRDVSIFLRNIAGENGAARRTFRSLFHSAGGMISPQTENAVLDSYMLPSVFNSGGKLFPNLVNALSLYSVAEREINAMSPAEIESVFYSFAGTYFKKIILYGWIGLFAGLLSYALGGLLPHLL